MSDQQKASTDVASDVSPAPGLLRSSLVVGLMTMLSRFLGLARDIIIAALAGATAHADAFFIAFKIPQFLRRLFAEGAFSQAFVPVLSEYRRLKSFDEIKLLVNKVSGSLGLSVLIVSSLAVAGAPVVATVFAPGFVGQPEKFQLTVDLIRITFPYLFFITMTGFAGAVLNSYGRFAVPAFTPVILNACLISAALWGVSYFDEPVMALAWGVFVAGASQFLFQLPFLAQLKLLPRPEVDVHDDGVVKVITLMIPALFGVSVSQINLLLDTVLASFLPTGSVSWLYYSDRLVELPLGVFAIAVSTVILPSLSRKHADASKNDFAKTLDWAMRMILLISLPAALALLLMAEPILITLFKYGALSERDVSMASFSLMAYSLGLIPFMLIKILAPGYFAQQDTKTPMKIGIVAMVVNMVLNVCLVVPLNAYYQLGHVGLALATVLSAGLNAGLLFRGLYLSGVYQVQPGFWWMLLRYIVAVVIMGGALFWFLPPLDAWVGWGWQMRVLNMAGLVIGGAAIYLVSLFVMGLRLHHLRMSA
ncbi:putative lipid II flippase MurJ [BD1-7 clade bacterium]|uniref:Probable lipid II flippase MurJ n=1 Tax=BD1-7 clade bacterium TaxID=2029982 RepID=A0A5S9QWP7_9GAMM|nr:putative lipid II flippase MurJ [BD1-7 clade bacterium]